MHAAVVVYPQDSNAAHMLVSDDAAAAVLAAAQAHQPTHQPTHLAEHDKALLDHTFEIILIKPPAQDTHTHTMCQHTHTHHTLNKQSG